MTRRAFAAALPALAACAQIPELPDDPMQRFALLGKALDGAPVTEGNAVRLMDGAETLAEAFRLIAGARDHIHLEFYILQDLPGPNGSLFALLQAKLSQGVAVTLVRDAFGSADTDTGPLEAAGAKVLAFHPLNPLEAPQRWLPNDRDHRKILVVDGRVAITGGVNLDRVYLNPCEAGGTVDDPEQACWRDAAIRIEGPAVASLQRLFLDTWAREGGAALPPRDWFPALPAKGSARIRILGSSPGDKRPQTYLALLTAVEGARRSIRLCTGYFVPTWQMRRALRAAARRGVSVQLLLPGASDAQLALDAQRAAYDDLLESGAEIREVTDAVLHAKLAVVDGVWSSIGSSNLDRRSVAFNNEVDAIVLGRETAEALEALLARAWDRARPVTLEQVESRGLGQRLRELRSRVVINLL